MNEKVADLIQLLLDKTENRQMKWSETVDDDAFRTEVASNTITIESPKLGMTSDGATVWSCRLTLSAPSGKVLLQHSSADLSRLHQAAKWSALHTDEVIDELLQELRS